MAKKIFSFQISKRQFGWLLAILLVVAIFLRFYKLGEVPHGMTWDEAAIGYNGFAIFTTRRDEWLTRLPVSFWSFGDYKAPLAIYFNGLFTALFGMNLWAVRLPFAISGVVGVLGMVYLTKILAEKSGADEKQARGLALVAGGLMTFSPWQLHFSRIAFESGLSLTLTIWGLYFFLKFLVVDKVWRRYIDLIWSALSFVASIYAYHSAKIAIPLIVLGLVIWQRKQLLKFWKETFLALMIGGLTMWPLVKDALFGHGLERAGTLITHQGYSLTETIQIFVSQFAAHLSLSFLSFGQTTTLRHGDGQWGVLLPTTLILVLVSFYFAWQTANKKTKLLFWWGIGLVIVGLLPAALATEVPHANRALLALPGFILLAIFGLKELMASSLTYVLKRIIWGMFLLLHGLFFISYQQHYYTTFAAESAESFQDGYLEAFRFALPYERGEGVDPVDKIVFTSQYGQPYIYALFVRKTNPIWYQGGSLVKYEFKDDITVGDLERPNTLVVAGSSDDLLGRNDDADKIIYGSDGSVRFRMYLNR